MQMTRYEFCRAVLWGVVLGCALRVVVEFAKAL
jgi:hypothetical protein